MKKISVTILTSLFFSGLVWAQIPETINFQAIARNVSGEVMKNQTIMIQLSILDGSSTGNIVYKEIRSLQTNDYGSFSFQIGKEPFMKEGDFTKINWGQSEKFLKVDFDPTASLNFELTLGTIEFASVPYAFSAGSVPFIDLTGVKNGDILVYNSATEKFEPKSPGTDWNSVTNKPDFSGWDTNVNDDFKGDYNNLTNKPTIPVKISELSDVNVTGATNGQVLSFDGTKWTPKTSENSNTVTDYEVIIIYNPDETLWKFGVINSVTGVITNIGTTEFKYLAGTGNISGDTLYIQGTNSMFGTDFYLYTYNIQTGELISKVSIADTWNIPGFRRKK